MYVYDNPNIRSLNLPFFRWAFLDFYASNWHPLTWISHALDYAFWGLNPVGHHLTSNMLHAVNAFIVVVLVTRLLEAWKGNAAIDVPALLPDRRAIFITAGATGLLFGIHPIHVESIAWVAERKDLLCAMFFLLSMIWYSKYVSDTEQNTGSRFLNKQYLFSAGFFILALLSKPMAVTLPAVLLILDWHPFNRIRSMKLFYSAFAEKLPFFVLSLLSSALTILAQNAGGSVSTAAPLPARVFVAGKAIVAYLGKTVLPLNLIPFYPYPANQELFSFEYLSSIVLVLGITAVCLLFSKKHRIFLSVWGYYVLTLLPVLGIIQVGRQSMADRYAYLPSLGPFLITGLLAAWIMNQMRAMQKGALIAKLIALATAVLVLGQLSFLTLKQIHVWKDSLTLWTYVIEKEPGQVPFAHNNLGIAYDSLEMHDRAIEQYQLAIGLKPDYAAAHNNMGNAYLYLKRFDRAIEQYQIAVNLKPGYANPHYNLGVAYYKMGDMERARTELRTALKIRPDYERARMLMTEVSN
ncbi:MAG: tetratricopeptide repeat protein [Nitrospirae bacterium]|nr:tetratricopeptide repeat protein [Nitrospirota bacterium]